MIIVLRGPQGERHVPTGKPYKMLPGEKIIGSLREETPESNLENIKLKTLAQEQGIGVGDLVHKLTGLLGISHCERCQERKLVLNKLRINGWKINWDKEEK